MVKPDRPQLGASGLTNWAQFLHDAVVDALLTDDGDLQPGVALPEGGDPGNVVLLDSTLTPVWGTAQGEQGDPGLVWRSDWLSTEAYAFRDAVRHNGAVWYATVDIAAGDEPGVAAEWELLVDQGEVGPQGDQVELRTNATHIQWRYVGDPDWIDLIALDELEGPQGEVGPQGVVWRGPWDSTTAYVEQDAVGYEGSSWIALSPSTDSAPSTSNPVWDRLARAAEFASAVLDDLTDVDTVGRDDGQALVWDEAASMWVPGSVAGGNLDGGAPSSVYGGVPAIDGGTA